MNEYNNIGENHKDGVLFDVLDVRNAEGTWHKIQLMHPFALLAVASAKSLAFLRLIRRHATECRWATIAVYSIP